MQGVYTGLLILRGYILCFLVEDSRFAIMVSKRGSHDTPPHGVLVLQKQATLPSGL